MNSPNKSAPPPATASAPEKLDTAPVSPQPTSDNEEQEVVELLREIRDLLSEHAEQLSSIADRLNQIYTWMP